MNVSENTHSTEGENTPGTSIVPIGQLWEGEYERCEIRSHRRPKTQSPARARRLVALALVVGSLGGASVAGANVQQREDGNFTIDASADRVQVNGAAALAAEERAEQHADRSRRSTPPPSPTVSVQVPATKAAPRPTKPPARKSTTAPAPPNGVVVGGNAATVVAFAKAQVGKRYSYGAAGPDAYDCSGLTMAAYARIGVKLPHSTYSQIKYGRAVSQSQLLPGDLVFSNGTGHVAIYIGGGQVVHASTPSTGVKISKIYDFEAGRRLVG